MQHLRDRHQPVFLDACADIHPDIYIDYYQEAIAVIERSQMPRVGYSNDRRVFDHLTTVFNDDKIKALVCFMCAQIKTDTKESNSDISMMKGSDLRSIPGSVLEPNMGYNLHQKRCGTSVPPLRSRAADEQDLFADWCVQWDREDPRALLTDAGEPVTLLCYP